MFVVEVDGTDVVEMTVESEETAPRLVAVAQHKVSGRRGEREREGLTSIL